MSDDFEDLLRRWLRDRAGNDRSALQALAGNVAALPPRRQRGLSPLASAAVLLVALALGAFLLAPRFGSVGGRPEDPSTNGEAATWDLELARCGASLATSFAVFPMEHARDYRLHLPAMLLSPELDVDDPAFVVVYGGMQPFAGGGAAPPAGQSRAPRSLDPGHHDLCVLVGADAATAELNIYANVDTTGIRAAVESPEPAASTVPPNLIPMWAVNIAGQLDCDGPVASIGGEYPESFGGPDTLSNTAEDALAIFLGPSNPFASLPTAEYTQLHAEPHWASFGHLVDGRPKAIVLLTDTTEHGPGWQVAGLRACDASEFDPTVPLTFPVTIWTDDLGTRISTETIRSMPGPAHCGWDSATWLRVEDTLYFRDPEGVMAEWTATSFAMNAELPPSAIDSGYRSGGGSLWLDPGRDAYMVLADRVERWPRSSDPQIGCM